MQVLFFGGSLDAPSLRSVSLRHPRLLLLLPRLATGTEAAARMPLSGGEAAPAEGGVAIWSLWDETVRELIKQIIRSALPIVAKDTIRKMQFDLGGRLQPANKSWSQAYRWALVLIIVSSVICVGVVAVVLRCIVLERSHEAQMVSEKRGGGSDEGNASSHRAFASRLAPLQETHAEEESDYYYSSYTRDEDSGDRSLSISSWDAENHVSP